MFLVFERCTYVSKIVPLSTNYICGKCDGKHISWFSKLKKDQERDESSSDNVGVHVVVLKGTYETAKGKVAGISRDNLNDHANIIWGRMSMYLFERKLS